MIGLHLFLTPLLAADLLVAGHYEFVSLLPDDYTSAKGSMFVLQPGTKAVVFDMDGTITVGDSQVRARALQQYWFCTSSPMERCSPAPHQAEGRTGSEAVRHNHAGSWWVRCAALRCAASRRSLACLSAQ